MSTIVPPYAPPVVPLGHYSPHFARLEMYASDTAARRGIDNRPPAYAERNLVRLCNEVLEPLRAQVGPIRVTSGYRCPRLNEAIGGSSTSAHMDGLAADIQPLTKGFSLKKVMGVVLASGLPFDQVIYEFGGWVHLGISAVGIPPRRQALMIFRGTTYLPYDPSDSRVPDVDEFNP